MSFSTFLLFHFVLPSILMTDWAVITWWMIPAVVFTVSIPLMLFVCSGWMVFAWLTRRVDRLEISDSGIRFGSSGHNWGEIKWLACSSTKEGTPVLIYQPKGFAFNRYLLLTDQLTEDEVEELFELLEKEVVPKHEGLELG